MNADWLFLRRLEQIALLVQRGGAEIQMLDLAALLRKILFDQKALADTVNTNKLKLQFTVGILGRVPIAQQPHIQMLGSAIDPTDVPLHPEFHAVLTRNQFGQSVVGRIDEAEVTVKDVIRFAANVAGGVHYDPMPGPAYAAANALYEAVYMNGMPLLLQQVVPIAKVALRGLEPLYLEVKARSGDAPLP